MNVNGARTSVATAATLLSSLFGVRRYQPDGVVMKYICQLDPNLTHGAARSSRPRPTSEPGTVFSLPMHSWEPPPPPPGALSTLFNSPYDTHDEPTLGLSTPRGMSANDVLQFILSAVGVLQILLQLWWCLRRRVADAGTARSIGAQTPPLRFDLDAAVLPATVDAPASAQHVLFTPSAAPPTRRLVMPASTPRSRTSVAASSAIMRTPKPRLDTSLRNRSR